MIIPYFKTKKEGAIVLMNEINDRTSNDITYCCADMMLQLLDKQLVEIDKIDPPRLLFKNANYIKIIRFCPNCGEKVETKRIEKIS